MCFPSEVASSSVLIASSNSLLQWAVLTCGHCFCNECIAIIVEQYSVGSRRRAIKCAICRQTTSHTEISYVFTTQSSSQDQDIPVKVSQQHSATDLGGYTFDSCLITYLIVIQYSFIWPIFIHLNTRD